MYVYVVYLYPFDLVTTFLCDFSTSGWSLLFCARHKKDETAQYNMQIYIHKAVDRNSIMVLRGIKNMQRGTSLVIKSIFLTLEQFTFRHKGGVTSAMIDISQD
jgi:hypothetical protein